MRIRRQKTFLEKAQDAAQDVAEQVRPQLEAALETARSSAHEARVQAAPLISQGKVVAADKAALAAEKASSAAAKASVVAGVAAGKAAELATEKAGTARDFATAKAAELRGQEPPKKKGGKLKKLALVSLLLAVGGLVFKKLKGGQADNWQNSYVPTPPPAAPTTAPTSSPTSSVTDAGGATPGEALADASEEPHQASTPDAPATVVDINDATTGGDNTK
ncbi:hypothetical protein [Nocardioides houyundeii]|uniref:hypothetical protein n=1 Tax=Nocardioides houyundeii TaxID=2045452 RepID=UPI000C770C25|nr:hypothetical protein [Nocardioides houyundeii]